MVDSACLILFYALFSFRCGFGSKEDLSPAALLAERVGRSLGRLVASPYIATWHGTAAHHAIRKSHALGIVVRQSRSVAMHLLMKASSDAT